MKRTNLHKIYLTATALLLGSMAQAQFLEKLGKKTEKAIERGIERTVERRAEKEVSKKTDQAIDGVLGTNNKASKKDKKADKNPSNSAKKHTQEPTTLTAQSKYDFVPGEKILFFDDFSQDPQGDFPHKWNTNLSGEVVTLKNQNGKWLRISNNTLSFPQIKGKLPQNFTIEFDLVYPDEGLRPPVTFGFSEVQNPAKQKLQHKDIFYFIIPASIHQNIGYSNTLYSGTETTVEWNVNKNTNKLVRAKIAVNGTRIRLYVNEEKIFDLPKGFDKNSYRNNFHFRSATIIPDPKDGFYVTNLRIAEATKDARSLLTEGKYETSGIYFDTNSDKIKPESHGVLKGIADVLNENSHLHIEIIGHTDNTGNEKNNQTLSEQRALSVKKYLNKTFGISDNRMTTNGKGQTQPIADNQTIEGKAQNRRVEFVKK